jgi:pilus assembly protein FimV
MNIAKKPSIFSDRSNFGSSDELDEYGVWVKSEPEDYTKTQTNLSGAELVDDPFQLDFDAPLELDTLPPFKQVDTKAESAYLEECPPENAVQSSEEESFDLEIQQDEDILPEKSAQAGENDENNEADENNENDESNENEITTELLLKIANELSAIKNEIQVLKKEFSAIRGEQDKKLAQEEPPRPAQKEDALKGFFDSDDTDETIALTGDELQSILSGTKTAAFAPEDSLNISFDDEQPQAGLNDAPPDAPLDTGNIFEEASTRPEAFDINLDELDDQTQPDIAIETEFEAQPDITIEPEIETQPDIAIETEFEAQPDITIEPEIETQPDIAIEPEFEAQPDITIEPEIETQPDIAIEPEFEAQPDITIEPEIETEIVEENAEEDPFSIELDMEASKQNAFDDFLSSELSGEAEEEEIVVPDLSPEDQAAFERAGEADISPDDILLTAVNAGNAEIEDKIPEKADEEAFPSGILGAEFDKKSPDMEVPAGDKPEFDTKKVPFMDKKPFDDLPKAAKSEAPSAEDFKDISLGAAIDNFEPEPKAAPKTENTEAVEGAPTGEFKKELLTVLNYMDQLLEALPEEKIEEFARSDQFEIYKKVFKDLGLV